MRSLCWCSLFGVLLLSFDGFAQSNLIHEHINSTPLTLTDPTPMENSLGYRKMHIWPGSTFSPSYGPANSRYADENMRINWKNVVDAPALSKQFIVDTSDFLKSIAKTNPYDTGVIDHLGNTHTLPKNSFFTAFFSQSHSGLQTQVLLLDENGNPIRIDGSPITGNILEDAVLINSNFNIPHELMVQSDATSIFSNVGELFKNRECRSLESLMLITQSPPQFDRFSPLKSIEPTTLDTIDSERTDTNLYQLYREIRGELPKPTGTCLNELFDWVQENNHDLWSDIPYEKRPQRIYQHSLRSFQKAYDFSVTNGYQFNSNIDEIDGTKIGRLGNLTRDRDNPHLLDPLLSPELMTCVAMRETAGWGKLSPHAINYSYCSEDWNSSAIGFSHMTRTTFSDLRQYNGGNNNLTPFVTLSEELNEKYNNESDRNVHAAMIQDIPMSMEVLLRGLNYVIKFKRRDFAAKGINANPNQILSSAIGMYDTDGIIHYVEAVVNRCLPCMQNTVVTSDASQCYSVTNYESDEDQ